MKGGQLKWQTVRLSQFQSTPVMLQIKLDFILVSHYIDSLILQYGPILILWRNYFALAKKKALVLITAPLQLKK